jgi:hypothetical protein
MKQMNINLKFTVTVCCLLAASACYGFSQGFVNLDFESANVSSYPPNSAVPVGDAIPGWTAYIGSTELTTIGYDVPQSGLANVIIEDANFMNGTFAIQGQYSIDLQPGVQLSNGSFQEVNASISQTGLVPVGTKSLTFDVETFGDTPFSISLGGTPLPLIELGKYVNNAGVQYVEWGANIGNYAGQTEPLTVTTGVNENSSLTFDSFAFSPTFATPVPEPSKWGLFTLSSLFFAWCTCGKVRGKNS